MVSNTSSLGDDLAEAKRAISDGAHAVGVALGLVEGDVIPGDPAKMREVADHLSKLGSGFERAGQGFKAIDDGGWKGHAADQFRSYLDTCPPKWFSAADAFTSAGRAVAQYAEVLAEAKAAAQRAKEQLEKAKQTSEAARERHNAEVDAYNQRVEAANAGGPEPGPVPGPFTDPAAADREAAEQAIRDAKARVQAAGDQAARALIAACEDAPAEPGLLTKLKENFTDSLESGGRLLGSVVGGALDAVGGLVQLARMIAPFDPYKFTHPAQSAEAAATLAMGLVGAVKDPYAAIKTTVDIDGWKNQPGRTLGSCIPDAIASLAGGAGTASRVASTTRRLTKGARELGEKARELGEKARELGERAGRRSTHEAPHLAPERSPFAKPHTSASTPGRAFDEPTPSHTPGRDHPDVAVPSSRHGGPPTPDAYMPPTEPAGGMRPEGLTHTGPFDHGAPPDAPRFGPQGGGWDGLHDHGPPHGDHTAAAPTRPGPQHWDDHPDAYDPWEDPHYRGDGIHEHHTADVSGHDHGHPDRAEVTDPDHEPPHHQDTAGRDHEPPDHGSQASEQDRQAYRDRIENRFGMPFEDAVAKLRVEHPELSHLPDEEAMSLRRYVGEDANTLNHTLRGGDQFDRDYLRPDVNVLRSALDQMPRVDTTECPRVFRDIGVSDDDLETVLERYKPGSVVEEPAFTSASKDIPPSYFGDRAGKENHIRFIIDQPANARDIELLNPDEREVIWQNGNRFQVQGCQVVGDETWIHMTDLGGN